jgi:hypothetical protein
MNPTVRVLVSVAIILGLGHLVAALSYSLSAWMDNSFNNQRIAQSSMGFGAIFFVVPLFFGLMAGLTVGSLFVITNPKQKGTLSFTSGTICLCICALLFLLIYREPGIGNPNGVLILCGPSVLWSPGLILYGTLILNGIRRDEREHNATNTSTN